MGKRAVYQNQGLAIYISREHMDELVQTGEVDPILWIGKEQVPGVILAVFLSPEALDVVRMALQTERSAVQAVRDQFHREHPEVTSWDTRRKAVKRAQRR